MLHETFKLLLPNNKKTIQYLIPSEQTWFVTIEYSTRNKTRKYSGFTHIHPSVLKDCYVLNSIKLSADDIFQLKSTYDIIYTMDIVRTKELENLFKAVRNNRFKWVEEEPNIFYSDQGYRSYLVYNTIYKNVLKQQIILGINTGTSDYQSYFLSEDEKLVIDLVKLIKIEDKNA